MSLRVLIAVTHLLGAGHLTRAAAVARAFVRSGASVTLLSGGMPAPLIRTAGMALLQLPPVRIVGTDFTRLLDEVGRPVAPARLAARRAMIEAAFDELRPDVVITELFPFGRRVLADEFMALVERARAMQPRPLLVASVRDILAPPAKPGRHEWTLSRLAPYDAVLVHGDPALVALDASWPVDLALRTRLHYTGYVDDAPTGADREAERPSSRSGIVVSGGSSAAALPLCRAAAAAAAHLPDQLWRVLVGGGVSELDFAHLRRDLPVNVRVERARPDFRALLGQAAVSVSQAGYNTVVDVLRSEVPAVLVPFEAGHETEQRLRADRLAELGRARVVPEADLSGDALAAAVRLELARVPEAGPRLPIALDGADRAVALVAELRARLGRTARPSVWGPLDVVLRRAADEGRRIALWWRDDDATADTPELERLLALRARYGVPLALAAIPGRIEPSLPSRLATEPLVSVLVHGLHHTNHAPGQAKKSELGPDRPLEVLLADAQAGLWAASVHFARQALPVLVPPWNRVSPELVPHLPAIGYRGLSTFGARTSRAPGLVQVNTHIDPIDWHGSRGLADPTSLVAILARAIEAALDGCAGPEVPIGLLTHHLVHNEAVWSFCDILLERLASVTAVEYRSAEELFSHKPCAASPNP